MLGHKLLVVLAGLLIAAPAHASETWACTYVPDEKIVTITLVLDGDGKKLTAKTDLVLDGGGKKLTESKTDYTVLENNEYALVGTAHRAVRSPSSGTVEVATQTVMVDKTFGRFIYNAIAIDEDAPRFRTGFCWVDTP